MDLELLDTRLAALREPRFRAKQVWAWTARGAGGYDEMTDVPAALRATLADEVPFSTLGRQRQAHPPARTLNALFGASLL
jgi:23S rRNA (adenine2503-C2)-methyltransferase